jgi:hypothetical protein
MPNTKIEQLQKALDLLKDQDVDELRHALELIGEPATAQGVVSADDFEVGKSYFIRSVTMYHVGRVSRITKGFVHLEESSWIADTGRFSDAMKSGNFNEVEPVGEWAVSFGGITDFGKFQHPLPTKQK